MKNVTITLDEETAKWARVLAAEKNVSLSRFVGEVLRERMRQSLEYDEAMRSWFGAKPFRLKGPPESYPTREEIHDRPLLRRR